MNDSDVDEVITAADHAAAIVERRGKTEYVGLTKTSSLRLPLSLFVQVQALAHVSGKSQARMLVALLEAGIEAVQSRLSEETLQDIMEVQSEKLAEHLGEVQ